MRRHRRRWQGGNRVLTAVSGSLTNGVRWLWQGLRRLGRLARQRPSVAFVLVLLSVFGSLAISALVPFPHNFEASLTVRELSFTTRNETLLLSSIYDIRQLDLVAEGEPQTLQLYGRFTSEDYPQLSRRDRLDIELTDNGSLSLRPLDPDAGGLEVFELRLNRPTTVENLRYLPRSSRLAFSLLPPQPSAPLDQNLDLYWGDLPLQLTLENVRLSNVTLPNRTNPQRLDLTFVPQSPQQLLSLTAPVGLSLTLPPLLPDDASEDDDEAATAIETSRWLWGGYAVESVQLQEVEETGMDVGDRRVRSTILGGKARMARQNLDLEAGQFLLMGEPGVQRIPDMQIDPEQGLTVLIAGRTRRLAIGLDRNFPIATITANWLARVFPKDVVVAVVSFSSAIVASMLSWLVGNLFEKPEEDADPEPDRETATQAERDRAKP